MAYKGVPFFQQPELTSVRRLRESVESDEALKGHHLHKGMMKVAQRHEDEGRPEVAEKIRRKAKKHKGSTEEFGRGREARRSLRRARPRR